MVEINGKTAKEVKRYLKTFLERWTEISDGQKLIDKIAKGEARLQRRVDIDRAVKKKLGQYKNPWTQLTIHYSKAGPGAYTADNDRFLVCMMHQLGHGNWDALKLEVRKAWNFRFDWYIKSRTPQELGRRCDTLVKLIEKEVNARKRKRQKK